MKSSRTARRFPTSMRLPMAWLLLAASASVAAPALAQYMWLDDKGVKQLSDRPPPPSVPDQRILKAPGKPTFNPNAPAADDGAPADAAAAPKPAPTLAERNADYDKRRADAAQAAQQAAQEAERKANDVANCNAARQNQLALDQGLRMSSYDKNGERSFMSDAERAEAAKKNQKVLAGCNQR